MHEPSWGGYAERMNWTYWLAGAIGLAFIASVLILAAMRDRGRGKEVVEDLPERTAPDPAADPHDPRTRG